MRPPSSLVVRSLSSKKGLALAVASPKKKPPLSSQSTTLRRPFPRYHGRTSTNQSYFFVQHHHPLHHHGAPFSSSQEAKHCETCNCPNDRIVPYNNNSNNTNNNGTNNDDKYCCGIQNHTTTDEIEMPPPLPEPSYSVLRRTLPTALTALHAPQGREYLIHALQQHTAAPYFALMEHFSNQSDPAFCAVTTLVQVLNALGRDPHIRWKGGWRYFGNEETLLSQCCMSLQRIQRVGLTVREFQQLATCQGLVVTYRSATSSSIDQFRDDVKQVMTDPTTPHQMVVTSFGRSMLGQTGDGHFSTLAAWHNDSNHVLVLDVARFKYPPYWVSIEQLYQAMCATDKVTGQSRGWYRLEAPRKQHQQQKQYHQLQQQQDPPQQEDAEQRRPAHLVPTIAQQSLCPIHPVKKQFCPASKRELSE